MLSDYHERKEAKIERFQELAQKNTIKSNQLHNEARKMADVIPLGQPILVGHHSEKRDRNYRDRIWNKMDKAVGTSKKAEYYAQRAVSAENNNAISSDNPDAIEELKEKLVKLEKFQEQAKLINAIIRKKKITQEEKIKQIVDLGYQESTAQKLFIPDFAKQIGIPAYKLTNNNANIRRIKERIEELSKQRNEITKEYVIGNIQIVDSVEDNRIMIYFPGVPDEGIRARLKSDGFRWSPSNKAWQAYRSAAWKVSGLIKMLSVMPAYVTPDNYLFIEVVG